MQIETRAASDAPFFKIGVDVKGKEYLCYVNSDNHGVMYPPKTDNCKSPSGIMLAIHAIYIIIFNYIRVK